MVTVEKNRIDKILPASNGLEEKNLSQKTYCSAEKKTH